MNRRNLQHYAYFSFHYIVLSLWAIVVIGPILWVVVSSVKPNDEVFRLSIPSLIKLDNYLIPFQTRPYGRYYLNSVIFVAIATFSNLFFCSLTGYGFAKYRFWGRDVFFIFTIATMMIPVHVIVVPLFLMFNKLRWIDSFPGLISPFLITAFGIFLMRQHARKIPNDYIYSARIDGTREFGIYLRVILPLSKSIVATLAILNAIGFWDEFLWPLIIATSPRTRTLSVGISMFITSYQTPVNQMFAVSVCAMAPLLVAYAIGQRHFIRSLALTGLKE